MAETILCEVIFCPPAGKASRIQCKTAPGSPLALVIQNSGILQMHPEIDLKQMRIGVFGKLKQLEDTVQEHDRIEIYRHLQVDPKTARRLRVRKKAQQGNA